ncbi:MAG: fumarylacetoacetate hydrolase family protein, partial [Desulfobacterales bacterium]
MRLATLKMEGSEKSAIATRHGLIPLAAVNRKFGRTWPTEALELITSGGLKDLTAWYIAEGRQALEIMTDDVVSTNALRPAPLYRRPRKIWGIGLNYADHAADLSEKTPTGIPGSFMKPDTTLIGPGDVIQIPELSQKTTAEGELGVVI